MPEVPAISILLPVQNGEAHLREAILSILAQTFTDFELLLIDDASTDCSPDIIEEFAREDSRIRMIRHSEGRGVAFSLNEGIESGSSAFIARMDADDICLPHRLERQMDWMGRRMEVGACGTWTRWFGGVKEAVVKYPCGPEAVRAFLLFGNPVAHPTAFFRRAALSCHGLRYTDRLDAAQDLELWNRCVDCFPVGNVPEVLLKYRIHDRNVTSTRAAASRRVAENVMRSRLSSLGIEPSAAEFALHSRLLCPEAVYSADEFNRVSAWFGRLWLANSAASIFDITEMGKLLRLMWFRMAMSAVRKMGATAWQLYKDSRWAGDWRQRSVVRLAAIKADLCGRCE